MATTIVCDTMAEILFLFPVGRIRNALYEIAAENFDLGIN
jgi:hypothetical protein